jgi:tetratricopeptide (TPR) repeat protein
MCILQEPAKAALYAGRAASKAEAGLIQEAVDDFERALNIDTGNGDYYLERALLHLQQEQFEQSELDLNQALKYRCSDLRYAYMARGLVRFNQKKGALACADWEKASLMGSKEAAEYLERFCKRAEPHE